MRILFIAPIPPPIDGQSKASKVLLDKLIKDNEVEVVNLNKKSLKEDVFRIKRAFQIVGKLIEVCKKRKNKDIIYLSLAESFVGNIRDISFYLLNFNQLDKTFVHMLGGAGMKKIIEGKGLFSRINTYLIRKLGGIIVEGQINYDMFGKVVEKKKIHIVPNFAEDFLFVSDQEIEEKFIDNSVLKVLYLSNLIKGKGYAELADAFISLPDEFKSKIEIKFVGGFSSVASEKDFLAKIKPFKGLQYLGNFIDGEEKRSLYCKTHVFCLPTYYPFEGQPISILEAYAAGCLVITTNHSGIPFVFQDQANGLIVEKRAIESIKTVLKKLVNNQVDIKKIALFNRDEAIAKYRTEIYQDSILKIFEKSILE